MSSHGDPSVSVNQGLLEIEYDSDGILALPEGTQYSRKDGEFETTPADEILAVEEGTTVYLEENAHFETYDFTDFMREAVGQAGHTKVHKSRHTKLYDSNMPAKPSGNTKVFDTSGFEIGNPVEYTKMMKENADKILLELADKDVEGAEAADMLGRLFESMNETYDRFVYGGGNDLEDQQESESDRSMLDGSEEKESTAHRKNKTLTEERAKKTLLDAERRLEEDSGSVTGKDEYMNIGELLEPEQTEISDFADDEELEGQSEISDY